MIVCLVFTGVAEGSENWKAFFAPESKCQVSFPIHPQHVKERLFLPMVQTWVEYDVYLSPLKQQAIFVMMIAEYPKKIEDHQVSACLESFLQGMVGKHGGNTLIFADINEIKGKKALEFFLQMDRTFFRGKIFVADRKLFLLAVETLEEKETENLFHPFAESFQFTK